MNIKKIKETLKEHKAEIICGGIGVIVLAVGGYSWYELHRIVDNNQQAGKWADILKAFKDAEKEVRISLDNFDGTIDMANMIDEDIYTDLAMNIERAVVGGSGEDKILSKFYDVGNDMVKNVVVNIKTIPVGEIGKAIEEI